MNVRRLLTASVMILCMAAIMTLPNKWNHFFLNDSVSLTLVIAPAVDDIDGDGVDNVEDNCPDVANNNQEDSDEDGIGDACESNDDDSDDDDEDSDENDDDSDESDGTDPDTTIPENNEDGTSETSDDDLFASISPTAIRPLEPFEDVPVYNPRFHDVQALKMNGVVHGIEGKGKYFAPERSVTRAELLKISLVSAQRRGINWSVASEQKVSFSDVPENHSLYPYIQQAVQNGIVRGYADGTFRPDYAPTFGETMKILLRSFNETPASTESSDDLDRYVSYGEKIDLYSNIIKPEKDSLVPRIKAAVLDHALMYPEESGHTTAELEWFKTVVEAELASLNAELALLKGYQSPLLVTENKQAREDLKIKLDGLRSNIEQITQ